MYTHNVLVDAEGPAYLKISQGATFEEVSDSLFRNHWVNDMVSFSFLAKLMDYQENVRPGRYEISPNMTNRELIRLLRSGRQSPINITFNNIRTKEDLAEKITRSLEIQEGDIFALLTDSTYIDKFGFNDETIMGMFIPNTYEVYWNISAVELFDRMHTEYQRFWNDSRKAKAEALGMDCLLLATGHQSFDRLAALAHLRGVAPELLTQRQRRGVHQVGAADLDDRVEGPRLGVERSVQVAQGGNGLADDLPHGGDVHHRREAVVRRPAAVRLRWVPVHHRGQAPVGRPRGGPPAREAAGQDHRRVLGPDHRGRRQLPAPGT